MVLKGFAAVPKRMRISFVSAHAQTRNDANGQGRLLHHKNEQPGSEGCKCVSRLSCKKSIQQRNKPCKDQDCSHSRQWGTTTLFWVLCLCEIPQCFQVIFTVGAEEVPINEGSTGATHSRQVLCPQLQNPALLSIIKLATNHDTRPVIYSLRS